MPEDQEKFLRRITAQCDAKQDQWWRDLEKRLPDLLRIGMEGPQFEDKEFIKKLCVLLGYEVIRRGELRKEDGVE